MAPIALYPDALVAQILAGSTYPTQIVEADRWMQQNSSLKGEDLAKAVDPQPWDESVKALTQFPSVLDNMSKNLSWTSALGDAYFNQQQDVMKAVQELRRKAKDAGNLENHSATDGHHPGHRGARRLSLSSLPIPESSTFPLTTRQSCTALRCQSIPATAARTWPPRPSSSFRRRNDGWSGHQWRGMLRLGMEFLELQLARRQRDTRTATFMYPGATCL